MGPLWQEYIFILSLPLYLCHYNFLSALKVKQKRFLKPFLKPTIICSSLHYTLLQPTFNCIFQNFIKSMDWLIKETNLKTIYICLLANSDYCILQNCCSLKGTCYHKSIGELLWFSERCRLGIQVIYFQLYPILIFQICYNEYFFLGIRHC